MTYIDVTTCLWYGARRGTMAVTLWAATHTPKCLSAPCGHERTRASLERHCHVRPQGNTSATLDSLSTGAWHGCPGGAATSSAAPYEVAAVTVERRSA